jgi:hypothetical protein
MSKRKVMFLYGEPVDKIYIGVPRSKKKEIVEKFQDILSEYENPQRVEIQIGKEDELVPVDKKTVEKIVVEKKSNPTDDVIYDATKNNHSLSDIPIEFNPPKKETTETDSDAAKKAKIELARSIVSGNGPKSADIFTPKKLPLEEKYEFEENTTLPDIEYRIAIGTKGIAFTDMYDASFVYLRFGHRTLRFSDRKEFDRFVKEESVLL